MSEHKTEKSAAHKTSLVLCAPKPHGSNSENVDHNSKLEFILCSLASNFGSYPVTKIIPRKFPNLASCRAIFIPNLVSCR